MTIAVCRISLTRPTKAFVYRRLEKGLKALEVIIVGLQSESKDTEAASEAALEAKVSSSNARKELLGELLKPPQSPRPVVSRPYLIGLTGGSASGKSTMARRFSDLGAGVVDCDGLGHTAYQPGTECFEKVADAFGRQTVIGANGEIDRAALGRIVFADPGKTILISVMKSDVQQFAYVSHIHVSEVIMKLLGTVKPTRLIRGQTVYPRTTIQIIRSHRAISMP